MARRRVAWKARLRRFGGRTGKWIAGATAVISLVVAIQQLGSWVLTRVENAREADALIDVARQQASRQEFAQAWASLDRAAAIRDDDRLAEARVDIAFAWLQDGRPGPGNQFSGITDTVAPALDRALLGAQGTRRADILAHIGWAAFLRSRDTGAGDPAARYQDALASDRGNVFANAMWGHWVLWRGGTLEDARSRFETALASGRERPFVRRLMIAALGNRNNDDADRELLHVANDMRLASETLDAEAADRFFRAFTWWYGRSGSTAAPVGLDVRDIAATYEYVVDASPRARQSGQLQAIRAALQSRSAADER